MVNNIKYYISSEHPIELNKEIGNFVGIYSKSKNNDKLIIIKELKSFNINMRTLFKNDFVYEITYDILKLSYDKFLEIIESIIKYNIFNEFNAIEIYSTKNENLVQSKNSSIIIDINENIDFKLESLITIGLFKLDKVINKDIKDIKILGIEEINNSIVMDIESDILFYFDENDNIEEIGTKYYIQELKINNFSAELDSSHNIYFFKSKELEGKKNAFEKSILLQYNIKKYDICITRLIYNINKNLDTIDKIDIKIDNNGSLETYSII
ncbi:MAG: hypothetical protein RSD22_11120 [Romboutsia sp.]